MRRAVAKVYTAGANEFGGQDSAGKKRNSVKRAEKGLYSSWSTAAERRETLAMILARTSGGGGGSSHINRPAFLAPDSAALQRTVDGNAHGRTMCHSKRLPYMCS